MERRDETILGPPENYEDSPDSYERLHSHTEETLGGLLRHHHDDPPTLSLFGPFENSEMRFGVQLSRANEQFHEQAILELASPKPAIFEYAPSGQRILRKSPALILRTKLALNDYFEALVDQRLSDLTSYRVYGLHDMNDPQKNTLAGVNFRFDTRRSTLEGKLSTDGPVLGCAALANIYKWGRTRISWGFEGHWVFSEKTGQVSTGGRFAHPTGTLSVSVSQFLNMESHFSLPFFYKNSKVASLGALFNYDYGKKVAGLKAGLALNTHDILSNSTLTIASDLDRNVSVEFQQKLKTLNFVLGMSTGKGGQSFRCGFRTGQN